MCTSVIVLRYRSPEIERGFRTPGMPVIPPSGWLRFSIWLVIGLVIYGLYGYRRAHLNTARNN